MAPALVDERGVSLVGVRGPYTHSHLTRRPSGSLVSTSSTRVSARDGPSVAMIRATIRRDSHMPHARSGGINPLIGRNVYALTAAAPRERSDPRAGTPSVMQRSQYQMVTLVNGSFARALRRVAGALRLTAGGPAHEGETKPFCASADSVDGMVPDVDIEASGLLDGLEGEARQDRRELIAWLLGRGFSLEHIRGSVVAPVMLPSYRVLGDDGTLVSACEVCESTGIELGVLERLQRAIGLPRIDDPDAAVLPRADAEAVRHVKTFLEFGYEPEDAVAVLRVLVESLGRAAAMMREAALKTLLRPGSSEIELAQALEQLAVLSAPLLGPMMDDLMSLELRHSLEMEAVNAAERAAGKLPGARPVTVAFADLTGFTRLGEALPAEELDVAIFTTGIMAGPKREVTAEGIERPQDLSLIRDKECDNGQGFLFTRPLSAQDAGSFFSQWPSHRRFEIRNDLPGGGRVPLDGTLGPDAAAAGADAR